MLMITSLFIVARLVEVNGVNIAGENHKQVVARIKSRMRETVLLVADSDCDQYHRERSIVITNKLPSVVKLANISEDDLDNSVDPDDDYGEEVIDTRMQKVSFDDNKEVIKTRNSVESDNVDNRSVDRQDSGVDEDDIDSIKRDASDNHGDSSDINDLGLNLSVEEVKQRIKLRRKHDPRTVPMKRASGEWWRAHTMIQNI